MAAGQNQAGAATRGSVPSWMWGAVVALVVFALYNAWEAWRAEQSIKETNRQIAELVKEQQRTQQELARAHREALILTDSNSMKIAMPSANKDLPPLQATWHQTLGLVVTGQKVPAPPANRTLQLWLIPKAADGKPVPSLTLRPGADGKLDLLVQNAPGSQEATKALAITEEPEGGSLQPTTTPIWVGAVPAK